MENCANEWNLILFDRYTPVNDKIGYGENRESDYLCILTIYNFWHLYTTQHLVLCHNF